MEKKIKNYFFYFIIILVFLILIIIFFNNINTKMSSSSGRIINANYNFKNENILASNEQKLFTPEITEQSKIQSINKNYEYFSKNNKTLYINFEEITINQQNVYSLSTSIYGTLQEGGFARIIAIDDKGIEYLIFGTDFLFIKKGNFNFNNFCEETCIFDSQKNINKIR